VVNSFVAILISIAANGLIAAGIVSLVIGYRARRAPKTEQLEMLGEQLGARLTEMARAIDSIAVEVERIGEAQRYLMLDRQSRTASAEGRPLLGRSITPH
jgi:hypothetical protein